MTHSPRVLIVILNYQTPALTVQCAESLRSVLEQFSGARLVVVDNGSGDALRNSLSNQLGASEPIAAVRDHVQLLCLPENGGYAVGNNAALRPALASASPPDYVWLLNSDTVVRPLALDALVHAMESSPRLGIAGSRLEDPDGTPQRSAFRFPTIAGEWEANLRWSWMTRALEHAVMALPPSRAETRVDWVAGASMLIRRAVLEEIGLLDEHFFLYYEDVDYCRRAAAAGWETRYIPNSRVEHQVGASSKITSARRAAQRMPPYWFAARRRYYIKHRGTLYAACADTAWLVGFGIRRMRQFLGRKPDTDPPYFWRDFIAYSIHQTRAFG